MSEFKGTVVKKPWGFEMELTDNENTGIWYLSIKHQSRTSLHSHPRKKTALIVLRGLAKVSFLNGSHVLKAGDKIMIREGVFHSTEAVSEDGLEMIEVETPNDKGDLLRLEDSYGRAGQSYEGEDHYVYDSTPLTLDADVTYIGECVIRKMTVTNKDGLDDVGDGKYIIMRGCVFYKHIKVVGPGDVVDGPTLKRLANKFDIASLEMYEVKLHKMNKNLLVETIDVVDQFGNPNKIKIYQDFIECKYLTGTKLVEGLKSLYDQYNNDITPINDGGEFQYRICGTDIKLKRV